jgi:DNA-binding MurR/RpiR family transcriptional regulator
MEKAISARLGTMSWGEFKANFQKELLSSVIEKKTDLCEFLRGVMKDGALSTGEKIALVSIVLSAGDDNTAHLSQSDIAKECSCSVFSVNKYVAALEACGYLSIRREGRQCAYSVKY